MRVPADWELAGLLDEHTGELERLATGRWSVPGRLELDGDWLLWGSAREDGDRLSWQPAEPASHEVGLLLDFVGLATGAQGRLPRRVLTYAKRHGVLRICEHLLPASHSASCSYLTWPRDQLSGEADPWWDGKEPVRVWSAFARQAQAMLNVASRLRRDLPGHEADWLILTPLPFMDPGSVGGLRGMQLPLNFTGGWVPSWVTDVTRSRQALPAYISQWLRWGDVGPVVTWQSTDKPTYTMAGRGLFGALAFQLLLAITSQGGYAACLVCQNAFSPTRKGNYYCPACRASGAAHRHAARESKGRLSTRNGVHKP